MRCVFCSRVATRVIDGMSLCERCQTVVTLILLPIIVLVIVAACVAHH